MDTISTEQLRRKMPATLRQVIAGRTFEVTYHGEPMGVYLSPEPPQDVTGRHGTSQIVTSGRDPMSANVTERDRDVTPCHDEVRDDRS